MDSIQLVQREVAYHLDAQQDHDDRFDARAGYTLAAAIAIVVGVLTVTRSSAEAGFAFWLAGFFSTAAVLLSIVALRPVEMGRPPNPYLMAKELDFQPPVDATPYLYDLVEAQLEAYAENDAKLQFKLGLLYGAGVSTGLGALFLLVHSLMVLLSRTGG